MDIRSYNREAWNRRVASGNPWTVPVSSETIAAARLGEWEIVLTPTKPVPREWFGELEGAEVLCLASGGGQQAPVLAAAGANVTVLDNSPAQLDGDRAVAEREGLKIRTELGTMDDLSRFSDGAFDLVVHPVSNVYVPDVLPVWREAYRVLKPGGRLLAGIVNPLGYIFDYEAEQRGELVVKHSIPYSDLESLSPEQLERYLASGDALEFGHTLEDQIGGQIAAGFVITGFYEDTQPERLLTPHIATYMATCAMKSGMVKR